MNILEYAIVGYGAYKVLIPKPVAVSVDLADNATKKIGMLPGILKITGTVSHPVTVSLIRMSDVMDSKTVSGQFTADLKVYNYGPHTVEFKDEQNNKVVRTIRVEIQDDVTPPIPPLDISKLIGSNYLDPVLRRKEKEPSRPFNPAYVQTELQKRKDKGQNFLRVVVYWEAMYPYAQNRENVLKQLEEIAKIADQLGISIVIDHHHFHGSSSWKFLAENGATRAGGGFPSYVVAAYPTNTPLQTSTYIYPTVKQFFQDWYSNTIQGFTNVWQEFFVQFWQPIIQRVDKYNSVVGYEILNELQYFDEPQIQLAGIFHTTIAGNMRAMTTKWIVWDEGNVRGNQINGAFARANQHLAAPQVQNIIYAPHTYGVGSQLDGHINDFKKTQAALGGIPVFIGEHAAQDNNLSFANIKYQLQSFKDAGFGATFWADAESEQLGPGNNLRPDANNPSTGTWYYQARKEVYGY